MARLTYTLPWTMEQLKTFCNGIVSLFSGGFLSYLQRTKQTPFVLVPDEEQKCKRFFHTEEEAALYYAARTNKEMTDEIAAYNFTTETVPGEEQYKLSFNILNVDDASTYGTTAKLRFTFATADTLNANRPTEESVEIYFTFTSDSGTKTDTKRFAYSGNTTEFDITEYLEAGENIITLVVTGLSSGLTLTTKATYTSVYLPFSSAFDNSADIQYGQNFGIPYTISGIGTKEVEFVIDGTTTLNDTVYDGTATKTYNFVNNLAVGLHSLQMKAYTTVNNVRYESEMLYFDFVVNGEGLNLTATLISAVFPIGTAYFQGRNPGLLGEQYVDYVLNWVYFSTAQPNATVLWKTKLNGVETVVGSRAIDEIQGTVGVKPDPVTFQPDTVGNYQLYAYIKGNESVHIGEYTINVVQNTAGLREPTPYLMKLDAKGRSNEEPEETLKDWSNNGYKATFNDKMTMDGLAGWNNGALRFDNGATGRVNIKPFATERSVLTNGGAIVFHFKTRNVEDEEAWLVRIGNPSAQSTAFFGIKGKKVIFRPSNGKALEYEFAAEEDTWLSVVVHPKTGVTDAQMMFFIFNGIEAPATPYGDTAVFNIGTNADANDTNGMIEIGNAEGKAAIDIYSIYVYNSMLSMWQGMNLYMINKGGDVASMMKKNNIFTNNNFDTPNINTIREKFRVLEVIGNLGLLETSNKKVNFYGSVRYTDPNAPQFNFQRMDGGAYIETAGQSRLEDLMAKSFHVDLNENDAVATYQDGKLCHKNRFIFAANNITENGVRVDLSGADSSICRNASHMKMINKYYPYILVNDSELDYSGYVLRTPPQRYALSGQWSKDMAAKYGGTESDYPWNLNINFAPDSVPIVVVWHEKEDDPIKVYGLACMTEEKKASYANGNHSIYLKEPLADGTLDPYDRYSGKSGDRGWDNEGVEEIEFVNPSDLTNGVSVEGFSDESTRDYSFELCFPKKKDLTDGGTAVWNTFLNEYLIPIKNTYNNQTAFDAAINDIIYMPSFAMYYNKCLDKKMNDSLCRNMHVIRYNMGTAENPKWLWWAKWWDADVSCGLFQSNAMGVDPQTDRQTQDSNGNYVMAGHDMWLWNALEKNAKFNTWCKVMAEASYAAGWSAVTEKAMQGSITNQYSEGLYNLDQLLKFLYAYRKGNDYMVRMQGRSTPYRHGFIDASYAYRESQMAIGAYAATSMSFRATNATYPAKVKLSSTVEWRFGLGTTTTNIRTGVVVKPTDGEVSIQIPQGTTLGRDFLSVYGADKIKTLDISDFCKYLSVQINLGNLSQIQKLYVGYPTHNALTNNGGFNQDSTVSFTGIDSISRLIELSIMGLHGLSQFDLSSLNHLTKFYASGSGLTNFVPADGTKFTTVELPDTLQTVEARNVQLGNVSFWSANLAANTLTEMTTVPTSLLTLTLVGMGSDEGAHQLVHKWCQMLKANPTLINTAQITYRAVHWEGIDKDDLLVLAQIPKAQRNITGYVMASSAYTTSERNILSSDSAFGANAFNINAQSIALVCDGPGNGVSISASGETLETITESAVRAEQGNSIQFVGAGFPLTAHTYLWRAWVDGAWSEGTASLPEITIATGVTLNRNTGILTTTENANAEATYRIGCYDASNKGNNGEIQITVTPRSYPTQSVISLKEAQAAVTTIDGELQITQMGIYIFGADNKRIVSSVEQTYTGRMTQTNGGQWTLSTTPAEATISSNDVQFTLNITAKPEGEHKLTLKYKSNWRNGLSLNSNTLKVAIVGVIEQLLINDSIPNGNDILYAAVKAAVGNPATEGYFTSQETKKVNGTFKPKTLIPTQYTQLVSLNSGSYFVPQYMQNVTDYDFEGCSGMTGDIDISTLTWAAKFSLNGTSTRNVNGVSNLSSLNTLKLHAPTKIAITNCPSLDINNVNSENE